MSNYSKLKALSPEEWGSLGWALALLPLLRISLKVWSFQSVLSVLEKIAPLPTSQSTVPGAGLPTAAEIASVVRMVNAAANKGAVKATCLPRSLTIWWLLRRRGVDCELRLGVKPRDAAIQAHAWVEHAGKVLNDDPDIAEQFSPFERVSMGQGKPGI